MSSPCVLRLDDWQDIEGIFDKICLINEICYKHITDNLRFMETFDNDPNKNEIYTTYSIELRDAYSHLVKILAYKDINSTENKVKINRQLERYLGHLEELLYDTYLRIIMLQMNSLCKKLEGKINLPKKKMEYAEQITKLRTMNDNITIEQKIENFEKVIDSLEKENNQMP